MIELSRIEKHYTSAGGDVLALKGVDLTIQQGEHAVIVGPSGSGKSTLLNLISGIDRPTSGRIVVNGRSLNDLDENELSIWRGENIGIVFQFYQLLPTLSVLDNLLFAMSLVNKVPKSGRTAKAERHLAEVGLGDKVDRFPNELSGGERQRVAVARALANDPTLIIADEPTGNLDSRTGAQINELLSRVNGSGATLLTVTHAAIKRGAFDRVLKIEDGVLSEAVGTESVRST